MATHKCPHGRLKSPVKERGRMRYCKLSPKEIKKSISLRGKIKTASYSSVMYRRRKRMLK